jgi:hypothetical protein
MEKLIVDPAMLQNLFKDDLVLCDMEMNMYSLDVSKQFSHTTNRNGVFELCSDRIHRLYPTYHLDKACRFMPGPETPNINFTRLKEILLSKDMR